MDVFARSFPPFIQHFLITMPRSRYALFSTYNPCWACWLWAATHFQASAKCCRRLAGGQRHEGSSIDYWELNLRCQSLRCRAPRVDHSPQPLRANCRGTCWHLKRVARRFHPTSPTSPSNTLCCFPSWIVGLLRGKLRALIPSPTCYLWWRSWRRGSTARRLLQARCSSCWMSPY